MAIGRWSPEKRLGRLIEMIAAMRRAGHAVRRDLIGMPGPPDYARAIRQQAAEHAEWVSLQEDLIATRCSRRRALLRGCPRCACFCLH